MAWRRNTLWSSIDNVRRSQRRFASAPMHAQTFSLTKRAVGRSETAAGVALLRHVGSRLGAVRSARLGVAKFWRALHASRCALSLAFARVLTIFVCALNRRLSQSGKRSVALFALFRCVSHVVDCHDGFVAVPSRLPTAAGPDQRTTSVNAPDVQVKPTKSVSMCILCLVRAEQRRKLDRIALTNVGENLVDLQTQSCSATTSARERARDDDDRTDAQARRMRPSHCANASRSSLDVSKWITRATFPPRKRTYACQRKSNCNRANEPDRSSRAVAPP